MIRFEHTTLVTQGEEMDATGLLHRVYLPSLGDDESGLNQLSGRRPTIVLLHGRHGTEDVPWIFARTLPKNWIVVAPRALEFEPESADHEVGYSWIHMEDGLWPELDEFEEATAAVSDFVSALPDAYPVDPNQTYFLGFSQGAAVAYATAIEYPGIVRGIAGLVGFSPEIPPGILGARPMTSVDVFMSVGRRDSRIPAHIAQHCRYTLLTAGASLSYNEYDVGHKLNAQGMRDLAAWWQDQAHSRP